MAWWNRVTKSLGGVVDAFEWAPELVIDIARAPFEEEGDFGGMLTNIWGAAQYRVLEQGLGGLKQPLDQALGGLPEGFRKEVKQTSSAIYERSGTKGFIGRARKEDDSLGIKGGGGGKGLTKHEFFGSGVLGFLDASYREIVGEPLSTAFTAGSIADSDIWDGSKGLSGLLKKDVWQRAHKISQSRSPGQALTLAVSTKDIFDEDELVKVQNTDWFPIVSGTLDAAARWYLSPDVIVGKAIRPMKYAAPLARVDRGTGALRGIGAKAAVKEWNRFDTANLIKSQEKSSLLKRSLLLAEPSQLKVKEFQDKVLREMTGADDLSGSILGSNARAAAGEVVDVAEAVPMQVEPFPQQVLDDLIARDATTDATIRRGEMDEALLASRPDVTPETLTGVKRLSQGPDAIKDRLAGLWKPDGPMHGTDYKHLEVIEDFIDQMGDSYFDDVIFQLPEKENVNGWLGSYTFQHGLVKIYTKAVNEEHLSRTVIHELNHHMSKFAPAKEVSQFQDEFAKVRGSFLKENPWLKSKLEGRASWGDVTWTEDEVMGMMTSLMSKGDTSGPASLLETVVKNSDGVYQFSPTKQNYRLFNLDEYFAEMVTDVYLTKAGQSNINYINFGADAMRKMVKSFGKMGKLRVGTQVADNEGGITNIQRGVQGADEVSTMAEKILGDFMSNSYSLADGTVVEMQRHGLSEYDNFASEFGMADTATPIADEVSNGLNLEPLGMKDRLDVFFKTVRHGGIEGAITHADRNVALAADRLKMSRGYWEQHMADDMATRLMQISNDEVPVFFHRRNQAMNDQVESVIKEGNASRIKEIEDIPLEDFGWGGSTSVSEAGIAEAKKAFPGITGGDVHRSLGLGDDGVRARLDNLSIEASQVRADIQKLKDDLAANPKLRPQRKIAGKEKRLADIEREAKMHEWVQVQKSVDDTPFFNVIPGDSPELLQAAKDLAIAKAKAAAQELPSFDELQQATLAFKTERIRDLMFHDMPDGELPASLLALAQDKQQMKVALSVLMGQIGRLEDLAGMNPGMALQFEDLLKRRLIVREFDLTDLHDSVNSFEGLMGDPEAWLANGMGEVGQDAIAKALSLEHNKDVLEAEMTRMAMIVDGKLEITKFDEFRKSMKYNKYWASEKNPLHVMFDMVAQPLVNFDDPAYIGKLKRHYRDSGMTIEQQEYWLGRIGGLAGDARYAAFNESIADGIQTIAVKHNLTDPELVKEIQRQISQGRIQAENMLLTSSKQYGGHSEKMGTNWSQFELQLPGGTTQRVFYPLSPEQLAASHVMPNFHSIDKALKKVAQFESRHPGVQWTNTMIGGVLNGVNNVWKPMVLLRPAWPMRVVLDEQLRMMSVIGTMKTMAQFPKRFDEMSMQFMRDYFPLKDETGSALFMSTDESGKIIRQSREAGWQRSSHPVASPKKAATKLGAGGTLIGAALSGLEGAAVGGLAGAALGFKGAQKANRLTEMRLSGAARDLFQDRYSIASAYGRPGDRAELYYDEVSAARTRNALMDRSVSETLGRRTFDPSRTRMYTPDDPIYEKFWNEIVNKQFHNSTYSKMLWDDELTNDDIVDFLLSRGAYEGQQTGPRVLRAMPTKIQDDPLEWVERSRGYLHGNVMPVSEPELAIFRQRLKDGGHVDYNEVRQALEDAGKNPDKVLSTIHGNDVIEIHEGSNPAVKQFRRSVDGLFRALGQVPTDNLSRNPFFEAVYQDRLKHQIAATTAVRGGEHVIDAKLFGVMQDQARRMALHEVRAVMYDLAENSRFAEMVSHLIPFFPAQQEVLTRWASLAVKNPVFFDRMMKVYDAPSKAGWTGVDSEGNEYVRVQLPEWAKGLVNRGFFKSAIDDQGFITFDPENLNMLNGSIGAGPIVNVAVSEIAKRRPGIEETLGFLYPYGIPTSLQESVAPAWFNRVKSNAQEDRSFASAEYGVAMSKITKAQLDGKPINLDDPEEAKQFYADVHEQTKKLFHLRTVTSLISPTAVQFRSPYQDFIEEYRKLKREDPQNADDKFLSKHGEAYFALTQSFTKTLDGVPATLQGEEARAKYETLIEAFPELGTLIIGEEGAGASAQFSSVIYKKQQREKISEGDPRLRRSLLSLQEVTTGPDVRLGWTYWGQFNDWLSNQMAERQITSLDRKGAEDLKQMKEAAVDTLRAKYPSWYIDYLDQDETKWLRRIKGMNGIVSSEAPGLAQRRDVEGLAEYLEGRKAVAEELQSRLESGGAGSLTAKDNADIADAWTVFQNRLVESNLAFGALWSRWLQNDTVQKNTWSV